MPASGLKSKAVEFVLHAVLFYVWRLIKYGLWFAQLHCTCNLRQEQNLICAWIKEIIQCQFIGKELDPSFQGKHIPLGLALALKMKHETCLCSCVIPCSNYNSSTGSCRCLVQQGCLVVLGQLAQMSIFKICLSWQASGKPFNRPCSIRS